MIISGVAVGAHIAWLSNNNNGCPLEVTLVAAVVNCAVTQGPLPALGGGMMQPVTVQGGGMVTVACPLTVTRGLGVVGCACPACMHITVAPTWMRGPGIVIPLR